MSITECTVHNEITKGVYSYRCSRCGMCYICDHRLSEDKLQWQCPDGYTKAAGYDPGLPAFKLAISKPGLEAH